MTTARSATAIRARAAHSSQRALLAWLLGGLGIASWVSLLALSTSPYGRFLEHGGWGDAGALAALCRAIPNGDVIVPALLHAAGWVLMIAAMMLPTTYPLLETFRRMVAGRPDRARLTVLVVLGFFVTWMMFGLFAHVADALVLLAASQFGGLIAYGWAIGAAVLAGAGLFQFSALKYRCLEECHAPFGFVVARWHGRSPSREAFRLGLDHGLFCVGCCWALMLVMFVVGVGNLGWMLLLAAVMAAEKNLPWGRRLRAPLGLGLVGWAGAIVLANV